MSAPTDLVGRLQKPDAVLTRTDLAALGYPRRAIDVIFKHVVREGAGVQSLPGFARPMITVREFLRSAIDARSRDDRVSP